jgi:predicted metalloprotease with PDZ domain
LSGLDLKVVDKQLVVRSLLPESPADKAGIKPGDIILTIQDKPAENYDLFDLGDHVLVEEGKRISMTIMRGDQTVSISLVLQPTPQSWPKPQTKPERSAGPLPKPGAFEGLPNGFRLPPTPPASKPAFPTRFH